VEALANGQQVICCKKSGTGFNQKLLENQLQLIENYNWNAFAEAMIHINRNEIICTPKSFYEYFNWKNAVNESLSVLNEMNRS
jgi:hypothetical protein